MTAWTPRIIVTNRSLVKGIHRLFTLSASHQNKEDSLWLSSLFWCWWCDLNTDGLIQSPESADFRRLRSIFARNQMVSGRPVSAVSIRSFRRVGHGVGQNDFRGFTKSGNTCAGVNKDYMVMGTKQLYFALFFSRLSLFTDRCVPTVWNSCTIKMSRMTASSITRYL